MSFVMIDLLYRGDLEVAILHNDLRLLMDAQPHFGSQQTHDIDIKLLTCLCPQSLEEMASLSIPACCHHHCRLIQLLYQTPVLTTL